MGYAIIVRDDYRPIQILTHFTTIKEADDYIENNLLSSYMGDDCYYDIIPVQQVSP